MIASRCVENWDRRAIFAHATLQKVNAKSFIHLKLNVNLWCLSESMNAITTRKVLKVEFKQFQRLPEWPPVKVNGGMRVTEGEERKVRTVPPPRGMNAAGSQTLAA